MFLNYHLIIHHLLKMLTQNVTIAFLLNIYFILILRVQWIEIVHKVEAYFFPSVTTNLSPIEVQWILIAINIRKKMY